MSSQHTIIMWRSYNVDILPCKRCTRLVSCIRGNLSDLKAQSLFMAGELVWLAMAIGRRGGLSSSRLVRMMKTLTKKKGLLSSFQLVDCLGGH